MKNYSNVDICYSVLSPYDSILCLWIHNITCGKRGNYSVSLCQLKWNLLVIFHVESPTNDTKDGR